MNFKQVLTILSLLVFCPLSSLGQDIVKDSLTAAIFSTQDSHEKVRLMVALGDSYLDENPSKSIDIAGQAEEFVSTDEEKLEVLNLLGRGYLNKEVFDSALTQFQTAYDLSAEINDSVSLSKAVNNIGVVFCNTGNWDEGLQYMAESAEIDQALKDFSGAAVSFANLGAIYYQLQDNERAKEFLWKSIKLSRKIGDRYLEATSLMNLGATEVRNGETEVGKQRFFDAIEIYKTENDIEGIQNCYLNLGASFRRSGKPKIAEIYFLKSLDYADTLKQASIYTDVYYGLALTNEELGKYSRALDYYKLYVSWKDTVSEQYKTNTILEMREKFNSEKTEKENELLARENQIQDLQNKESKAQLNQSRILVGASVIGLLMLIGIALVLFNRNRIKQRANTELQIANDIIQEKNDDILASIEYASKIQEALLPTKENKALFKDSFFILKPKDIVSGDFLWYAEVDNKVVFAAADCTGHGVPGAFMSMIGNTFLHQIINERKVLVPGQILDLLRDKVIKALSQQEGEDARKDGMDMAICVLDRSKGTLEFAGANNPMYVIRSGEMVEIKGDKQPVGYMPERNHPFTNHTVQLADGDSVYIFSDGYADQFGGPKGKKFKYKQLRELLHEHYTKAMLSQKEILLSTFEDWKGDLEQVDDVCMIGVRI